VRVTELAYLADPDAAYVREFRATVAALPPGGVVLDRTFFYPTGGGQPNDRGTIEGPSGTFEVTDVTKSGPAVVHRVRGGPTALASLRIGAEVGGAVDWERRYRHMRLHTGQHLLSARIFERTGLRTRRAALGGREASLDLERPLDPTLLEALRDDLRSVLTQPRPVSIRFVPRAEWDRNPAAARAGLVPLPPTVDPVRVVEIDATDVCPCGGTHLRNTVELGATSIRIGPNPERVWLTLDADAAPTRAP
jgi:misacylated tRNA(Ala) deacylase